MTVGGAVRVQAGVDRGVLVPVGVAAAAGIGLHTFGTVDALHHVLSDAAWTAAGAVLLGVACAALVVAAGVLARAARDVGHGPAIRVLLAVWAAGLAAVAIFPTGQPGTVPATGAVVHTWGAALVIAVPPVVGLLAARRRATRAAAVGTAVVAACYGVAHLPSVVTTAEAVPFVGLLERAVLVLVLVVVALTGAELRAARRAR